MDSHHTNKTYQEEYKGQLKNMIDEQIEQHIEMERRGDILRCRMTKKLNCLKLLHWNTTTLKRMVINMYWAGVFI